MIIALTFAVNSLLNFAFGLLIAKFLGPQSFGVYSIAFSLAILLNAIFTEWTRHAVIRFYAPQSGGEAVRRVLDWLLLASMVALMVSCALAWLAGARFGLTLGLLAATITAAMASGSYDYLQAVARVRRDDRAYLWLVAIRNTLSLLLVIVVAWRLGDPALVMAGIAASAAFAVVATWPRLAEGPLQRTAPDRASISAYAQYALPLVAASMLYATIPLLDRWFMAQWFGAAEAGKFAMASDIGLKLLCSTSTVIELVMLPATIALTERDGLAAAYRRVALTIVIGLAIMAPLTAGYVATLPAFEKLLVPEAFRNSFQQYTLMLLPVFLALSLAQACFNVMLIIEKKTRTAITAGLIAVLVNLLGLTLLAHFPSPQTVVLAMSAGFAASLLVVAGAALRVREARPPLRDVSVILGASALMLAAIWPLRGMGQPWLALPLMTLAGGVLYGAILIGFNTAGCRTWAMARLRR